MAPYVLAGDINLPKFLYFEVWSNVEWIFLFYIFVFSIIFCCKYVSSSSKMAPYVLAGEINLPKFLYFEVWSNVE